jgi:hypothetical protein
MRTSTLTCDVCGRASEEAVHSPISIAAIRRGSQQLGPDVDICEPCVKSIEIAGLGNVLKAWKAKLWIDSPP